MEGFQCFTTKDDLENDCLLWIKKVSAGHQWLTPVILATQEAEIRTIAVLSQPRQIVCETLS
jgi:hypothetical protein